VENTQNQVSVI